MHAGFVQIRYNGRWGSFCDWSWGLTQGHVICRELGYKRVLFTTIGGLFEKQSDGPIWFEEAVCTGNESSIFECDLSYIGDYDQVDFCDYTHSAGVICESNKEPGLNGMLKLLFCFSFPVIPTFLWVVLKIKKQNKKQTNRCSF